MNVLFDWNLWRRKNLEFYKEHLTGSGELLDVGSGWRHHREFLDKFSCTNMDIQPFPETTVVADFYKKFPFPDERFDVVYVSNTLEHCYQPLHLLRESARVLKKGGYLIGTVPFVIKEHLPPDDFFRYTSFVLAKLLEDAGFTRHSIFRLGDFNDVMEAMLSFYVRDLWRESRFPYKWLVKFLPKLKNPSTDWTLGFGFKAFK
jgi:SAM-dependent methyltransferase